MINIICNIMRNKFQISIILSILPFILATVFTFKFNFSLGIILISGLLVGNIFLVKYYKLTNDDIKKIIYSGIGITAIASLIFCMFFLSGNYSFTMGPLTFVGLIILNCVYYGLLYLVSETI